MRSVPPEQASRIALELYRSSFPAFIRKVFSTVSPGHPYVHSWHIDAMCEYLLACEKGDIKNLVINIPPRCMKTITVSVAWPAWLLGKDPTRQIIGASYSANLAMKDNTNTRYVIESPWYQHCFPDTQISADQNEKRKFTTTRKGHRIATSVGGTITGEGGDFLILDDPLKPDEALADTGTVRNKTNDWVDQTFMSRKNDPKSAVSVLIMQRLHEEDVAGHLIDKGWEHLNLPAEFVKKTSISMGDKRWDVNAGDLLTPERLGRDELRQIQVDLGSWAYAAQYLQNPAPTAGGLIKKAWFRFASERPVGFNRLIHSWDTASKDGVLSDYSCCTVWGVRRDGFYLLDMVNTRLEFPELRKKVLDMAQRDNPDNILIEDKSSGQQLLQDLRKSTGLPLHAIMPKQDKVTRLAAVSTEFENGNVVLPEYSQWLDDYVSQLTVFPNAKYDDMVDSTSQFLSWAKERNLIRGLTSQSLVENHLGVPTFNAMLNNGSRKSDRI